MNDQGPVRSIMGPLTEADLLPLEPDVRQIWIRESLSQPDYERIARTCAGRDDVHLFMQNQDEDLSILEAFPGLRSFEVASLRLRSLDGIEAVADTLESLSISDTLKKVKVDPLAGLGRLRHLYLDGHRSGIEVIAGLTGLEKLTLRSITLPDLSILLPLENLWYLDLKLGGTKDLALLQEVGKLRYLEIWRVRGLSDLSSLEFLPHLEELHLQSMSRVESLPSLAGASSLRRLSLDSMKGITDLRPVADAPGLEELLLVAMGHLEPADLECFVGHPSLAYAVFGLGSLTKNRAAKALLPLPHPSARA